MPVYRRIRDLREDADLTQKQVNDAATRIAKKLQLTADSILCLDLPMVGAKPDEE